MSSYRPSSIYQNNTTTSSFSATSNSQPGISALQARIAAKRAELTHLKSLRDLSASLATQMSALESQLTKLRDGTEAVAAVMGNWEGVLGVIGMVGGKMRDLASTGEEKEGEEVKDEGEGEDGEKVKKEDERQLPVTLVRIPVEQGDATGGKG